MQMADFILRSGRLRGSFHKSRAAIIAAALGGFSLHAAASPVTYTLSGTFSGSLGGAAFTNTAAFFTLTGDTSNVRTSDFAFFYNTLGTSTFQLGANTPVTFLGSTMGVESEYGAASFMDTDSDFAVGEFNEATPYDVLTNSGTTTGDFVSYGPNPELTSGGNLIITGATGDVTFQTSISSPPPAAVTPEPSSLLLVATGLFAAASKLARRRRSA